MVPRFPRAVAIAAISLAVSLAAPMAAQEQPGKPAAMMEETMPLEGTYWKIVSLGGEPVGEAESGRDPHILFHADGGLNATVGCNMMRGTYQLDGETLTFGPAATTMMACPPPLDAAERALIAVLETTAGYVLAGDTLSLVDADGAVVADLEAGIEP